MNADLDQLVTVPPRRGRRIVASLVGAIGTVAFIVGVLGLLVLSFVGSSGAASSSARSALTRADVRRAVAEELVDKLEEGGDNGVRIIIHVARQKVVDAVASSLNDSRLQSVAANAAATAYGVYVDGNPPAVVDIQMFADIAFEAFRTVDWLIPQSLSPQVDPIEISRDDGSPDLASIRTWARIAIWALLVGAPALLAISWFMSVAGRWLRIQRFGIRFLIGGAALIVLAVVARSISFDDGASSGNNGRISEALVSFATSRLLLWSIVLTTIGAVVALLGGIMNRRVTSRRTASA